jgi:uncharacterized protein with HEPN domain
MNFALKIFSIAFVGFPSLKLFEDLLAHQYFQIDVSVIKASIDQPLEELRQACLAELLG